MTVDQTAGVPPNHGRIYLPNIGSTDANVPLSRGLPAVCIGLTYGSGAHTLGETIQTRPLAMGIEQLYQLVRRAWSAGGKQVASASH